MLCRGIDGGPPPTGTDNSSGGASDDDNVEDNNDGSRGGLSHHWSMARTAKREGQWRSMTTGWGTPPPPPLPPPLHPSEVALCPLLPWYCVKLSWNVWFRDYQHIFYLVKVIFSSGIRLLQLNIIKFLIHCPTYHIFGRLLMSHKKRPISNVFLELILGIPLSFVRIVHKSCLCTKFWTWMFKASHLNFSLNTHFFVTNISSANPYFPVSHFYCCLTGNAFRHI